MNKETLSQTKQNNLKQNKTKNQKQSIKSQLHIRLRMGGWGWSGNWKGRGSSPQKQGTKLQQRQGHLKASLSQSLPPQVWCFPWAGCRLVSLTELYPSASDGSPTVTLCVSMMVDRDKLTVDKSLSDPGSISCYDLGGRENLLRVEEYQGRREGGLCQVIFEGLRKQKRG